MKTFLTTAAAVLMLFSTHVVSAADNPCAQKERALKALKKEIRKHMQFPGLDDNQREVLAFAEFRMNENGTVDVLQLNAMNNEMREFILSQAREMEIRPADIAAGETFKIRLRFTRVG